MDSTPNTQNANTEPASEGNITLTPHDPLESARESVQYDNDFINKIESQVEARLQKKLYAGRKQEKIDKKAHKEAIKNLDFISRFVMKIYIVIIGFNINYLRGDKRLFTIFCFQKILLWKLHDEYIITFYVKIKDNLFNST